MINPQKILAFLDVGGIPAGTWDPTLGVVFAAALAPMFAAYALAGRLPAPLWHGRFETPSRRDLDARLIAGSAIFGAGWGIAGLCPGPALAALPAVGSQLPGLLIFIAAMLAGIWLASAAPAVQVSGKHPAA
jgi:hypothetical protein